MTPPVLLSTWSGAVSEPRRKVNGGPTPRRLHPCSKTTIGCELSEHHRGALHLQRKDGRGHSDAARRRTVPVRDPRRPPLTASDLPLRKGSPRATLSAMTRSGE